MVLNLEMFVFAWLDIRWALKFSTFAGLDQIWWGHRGGTAGGR